MPERDGGEMIGGKLPHFPSGAWIEKVMLEKKQISKLTLKLLEWNIDISIFHFWKIMKGKSNAQN